MPSPFTPDTIPGSGVTTAQMTAAVGGVAWTVVTKALDESIASSTVLQNDDELLFTAVSGAVYEIQLTIIYGSPAGAGTPDLKILAAEDATARGAQEWLGFNTADAVATFAVLSSTASAGGWGTAAANRALMMWGHHVGAGATYNIQWSQNTSSGNATIVRAGSVLRYRRLL